MPRMKMSKNIAQNTDMNYIDGDFKIERIFQLAKQSEQIRIEIDFRFLWEWEKSWNLYRRF